MLRKEIIIFLVVLLVVGIFSFSFAGAASVTGAVSDISGFKTSNVLLKVSLKQGDSTSRTITISSDKAGQLGLEILYVPGVTLDRESFVLDVNEDIKISVNFNSANLEPGVYVGGIKVSEKDEESVVPIIFEVESRNVIVDVNLDIPPQYTSVQAGDRMLAQLKIFDLVSGGTTTGLGTVKADMEYVLYSLDGTVLSTETESVVVDQQTRVTKTLSLPEDVQPGDYVFASIAKYQGSVGTSSQLFTITGKSFNILGSITGSGIGVFIIIGGAVLFFFVGIIFFFVFMIKDRDKLFVELRKYNASELRKQREFLLEEERILKSKGHSPRDIEREARVNVKKLKKKQKERVREFRKLHKAKNHKEMLRELNRWKREGYNTFGLEYKLEGLSVKEMKSLMKKWKSEGYHFGKEKSEEYKKKK